MNGQYKLPTTYTYITDWQERAAFYASASRGEVYDVTKVERAWLQKEAAYSYAEARRLMGLS